MNEEYKNILKQLNDLPRKLNIEIRAIIFSNICLQEQNQQYKEVIDRARVLVNNVYNSLENPDKPIKFYEELLNILNINERN